MILPDDKEPTIVWDPVKGQWINTKEGDDEGSGTKGPPPKDSDLMNKMSPPQMNNGPTSFGQQELPNNSTSQVNTIQAGPPSWNQPEQASWNPQGQTSMNPPGQPPMNPQGQPLMNPGGMATQAQPQLINPGQIGQPSAFAMNNKYKLPKGRCTFLSS